MKTHALLMAAALLAACAGQGGSRTSGASGTSGTSGASAGGGGDASLNTDVNEAVSRGSTQGFSPHSAPPPGR